MSHPPKFAKNVKFSRNKTVAYSEGDILRNDAKLNSMLEERKKERTQNLKTAGKIVDDEMDKVLTESRIESNEKIRFERKYYTKMNLVVNNLPSEYDVDKLCKTFEQLGSIIFVSKIPNTDGKTYNAKIVPNEWALPISAIQQEIFDRGFSEYVLRTGEICQITRDREQSLDEYGDSYEYQEDEDDDDE